MTKTIRLQVKMWTWNVYIHEGGKTTEQIQNDINEFLNKHEFDPESFEIFEMGEGVIFARVLYIKQTKRTRKNSDRRDSQG